MSIYKSGKVGESSYSIIGDDDAHVKLTVSKNKLVEFELDCTLSVALKHIEALEIKESKKYYY